MNNIKNVSMKSLKDWLDEHNVNKDSDISEFESLFYNIDLSMKKLHQSGYYINNFNVNNIYVSNNYVKFGETRKLYYDDRNEFIHNNIYYLSCLAIGVYNDCLNYINPVNKVYLKNNFQDFATFIPSDVVPYYKGIFERDASVYLSDYVNAKVSREINMSKSLLDDNSSSKNVSSTNNSKSMIKSTLVGRLYGDQNDKAAFALIYIFPVIIILLAILIPILLILYT